MEKEIKCQTNGIESYIIIETDEIVFFEISQKSVYQLNFLVALLVFFKLYINKSNFTAFGGPADSYGLLPIATLDRAVTALDGGLHRIVLGRLRTAVMLQ